MAQGVPDTPPPVEAWDGQFHTPSDVADWLDRDVIGPRIEAFKHATDPTIDSWAVQNPQGYGWLATGTVDTLRDIPIVLMNGTVDALRLGRESGRASMGQDNWFNAVITDGGRAFTIVDAAAGAARGGVTQVAKMADESAGLSALERALADGHVAQIGLQLRTMADQAALRLVDASGMRGPCTPQAFIRALESSGGPVHATVDSWSQAAGVQLNATGNLIRDVAAQVREAGLRVDVADNPATMQEALATLHDRLRDGGVGVLSFFTRHTPAQMMDEVASLETQIMRDPRWMQLTAHEQTMAMQTFEGIRDWVARTSGHDPEALLNALSEPGGLPSLPAQRIVDLFAHGAFQARAHSVMTWVDETGRLALADQQTALQHVVAHSFDELAQAWGLPHWRDALPYRGDEMAIFKNATQIEAQMAAAAARVEEASAREFAAAAHGVEQTLAGVHDPARLLDWMAIPLRMVPMPTPEELCAQFAEIEASLAAASSSEGAGGEPGLDAGEGSAPGGAAGPARPAGPAGLGVEHAAAAGVAGPLGAEIGAASADGPAEQDPAAPHYLQGHVTETAEDPLAGVDTTGWLSDGSSEPDVAGTAETPRTDDGADSAPLSGHISTDEPSGSAETPATVTGDDASTLPADAPSSPPAEPDTGAAPGGSTGGGQDASAEAPEPRLDAGEATPAGGPDPQLEVTGGVLGPDGAAAMPSDGQAPAAPAADNTTDPGPSVLENAPAEAPQAQIGDAGQNLEGAPSTAPPPTEATAPPELKVSAKIISPEGSTTPPGQGSASAADAANEPGTAAGSAPAPQAGGAAQNLPGTSPAAPAPADAAGQPELEVTGKVRGPGESTATTTQSSAAGAETAVPSAPTPPAASTEAPAPPPADAGQSLAGTPPAAAPPPAETTPPPEVDVSAKIRSPDDSASAPAPTSPAGPEAVPTVSTEPTSPVGDSGQNLAGTPAGSEAPTAPGPAAPQTEAPQAQPADASPDVAGTPSAAPPPAEATPPPELDVPPTQSSPAGPEAAAPASTEPPTPQPGDTGQNLEGTPSTPSAPAEATPPPELDVTAKIHSPDDSAPPGASAPAPAAEPPPAEPTAPLETTPAVAAGTPEAQPSVVEPMTGDETPSGAPAADPQVDLEVSAKVMSSQPAASGESDSSAAQPGEDLYRDEGSGKVYSLDSSTGTLKEADPQQADGATVRDVQELGPDQVSKDFVDQSTGQVEPGGDQTDEQRDRAAGGSAPPAPVAPPPSLDDAAVVAAAGTPAISTSGWGQTSEVSSEWSAGSIEDHSAAGVVEQPPPSPDTAPTDSTAPPDGSTEPPPDPGQADPGAGGDPTGGGADAGAGAGGADQSADPGAGGGDQSSVDPGASTDVAPAPEPAPEPAPVEAPPPEPPPEPVAPPPEPEG